MPLQIRNPVYIGKIKIKEDKDEPEQTVNGIHEPLISEELFMTVQNHLNGKKRTIIPCFGKNERLPLRGFLVCTKCHNALTGSFSTGRSKRYGYYHCQKGCTERHKADEANQDFINYLNNYKVNDEILQLYYLVLNDVFKTDKKERIHETAKIEKDIKDLQHKLEILLDKYIENDLSKFDYERGKEWYEAQIHNLQSQKRELELVEKDFMDTVKYSFGLLKDLPDYYNEAPIEVKHKILGSIFPGKLIYENKKYRTVQINQVLTLIYQNINELGEIKKNELLNLTIRPLKCPRRDSNPGPND